MPYLIRSVLIAVTFGLLWSCFTFAEDGFLFFVPGIGGWFFEY